MNEDRWVFEISKQKMSRASAWFRCHKNGSRVGIPKHAWLKDHTRMTWCWYTATPEKIEQRERAIARRKEAHEVHHRVRLRC